MKLRLLSGDMTNPGVPKTRLMNMNHVMSRLPTWLAEMQTLLPFIVVKAWLIIINDLYEKMQRSRDSCCAALKKKTIQYFKLDSELQSVPQRLNHVYILLHRASIPSDLTRISADVY